MMGQSDNGCYEKVVYSQNGYPISQMNIAVHAQHISCYLATDFCSFFEFLSLFAKQRTQLWQPIIFIF